MLKDQIIQMLKETAKGVEGNEENQEKSAKLEQLLEKDASNEANSKQQT